MDWCRNIDQFPVMTCVASFMAGIAMTRVLLEIMRILAVFLHSLFS